MPWERLLTDDPVTAMAIADLDRDLDLDVVTVHRGSGRVGLLENLLHLQFRGRYLDDIPPVAEVDSIHVEDVDGNVSWDLIVGGRDGAAIVFSQTADAGAWTVERTEVSDHAASGLVVADFDNDSWLDLLVAVGDQPQLSRVGPWGFAPWNDIEAIPGMSQFVSGDFNQDGAVDLAGVMEDLTCRRIEPDKQSRALRRRSLQGDRR